MKKETFKKDIQFYKFCSYGFLKNLKFFEPFLMLFFLEKGLTFFQIGILYSIREIGVNFLEIPSGILADAFGRRRTMIFSFIAYIIAFLIFNFWSGFYVFVFAMMFFSFGEAFRTGTHKAMIFEYLAINKWTEYKVYYYGYTRATSQIGSAVSAVIAAAIVYYTGTLRVVFLYSTIPYFIDLLLMISYPKELDGDIQKFNLKAVPSSIKEVFSGFFQSFKDPYFLKALLNISVPQGFHKAVKDYLQPAITLFALSVPVFLHLEDQKRVSIMIGLFYTLIYILNSIASKSAGNVAAHFKELCKPLNLTLYAVFATGVMIGVFLKLDMPIIAIFGFLVIYVIENIRRPIGVSYISGLVNQKVVASVLSADSQISAFTASIIAISIGYLADTAGIGYAIIILSVILGIISLKYILPKGTCRT